VTARLGLVALGILAALGLAEGLLRVAATLDPRVRFLATGRATRPAANYATLEEFIVAQAAHITPHQPWYNHWSNAFGFHDEEFAEPKPPGRLRVLVVGDSFTFAPVPYPQGVVTLTEAALRAACGGRDLDLLNMGLMGAGPAEYRVLAELGAPRFTPDLVLVNLFVGNDAPDLHRHVHDRSPLERALRRSHVWTFGKNLLRARGGLREPRLPTRVSAAPPGAPVSRGGTLVEGTSELAENDPALVGPLLTEAAYQQVLGSDLGRFYRPGDEQTLRAAWQPILVALDAVYAAATRAGSRVALALLPSVLQVDATLRAATVARLSASLRYRGLSSAEIDPDLPNTLLREYARTRGIPLVDLTPAFVAEKAAGAEPLYKLNDNHWTPRGNRVAARSLTAFLAPLVCASR
jgi:acetyltransferase AlgX (SGNH hydrolase-like protein)